MSVLPCNHIADSKQFLQRLTELFDQRRTKDHGSVFLTQKRSTAVSLLRKQVLLLMLPSGSRRRHRYGRNRERTRPVPRPAPLADFAYPNPRYRWNVKEEQR